MKRSLYDYCIETDQTQLLSRWDEQKNGRLKPNMILAGSKQRVWWRCEKGHSWQARCDAIKAGSACPYCAGKYAIPGETDLATTHPHIMSIWSDQNELSPTAVTAGSTRKVRWICEKGHEWEARVDSIALAGNGCPYCAGRQAIPGETDLATLRPELMEQWDFEKNTLDPAKITVADHGKAWWKCELDHSWQATVYSRTREKAAGCPYCTGRQVLPGFNDLATLKPRLAEQWYQPLNEPLNPQDVTLGSNKKVWWQCNEGHVWHAFIYARTKPNGTGCPVCAGTVNRKRRKRYAAMATEES